MEIIQNGTQHSAAGHANRFTGSVEWIGCSSKKQRQKEQVHGQPLNRAEELTTIYARRGRSLVEQMAMAERSPAVKKDKVIQVPEIQNNCRVQVRAWFTGL